MNARIALILSTFGTLAFPALGPNLSAADQINFTRDIKPMLESACIGCHREGKAEGDLKLESRAQALAGGSGGAAIIPGKPAESPLYKLAILPKGDDNIMPPKGAPLSRHQTEVLRLWIEQGAPWPETARLTQRTRVKFEEDIQPLLELNCVACHREGHFKGGLRLDTRELAFRGGDNGAGVVPFQPTNSSLYKATALDPDDDALMPPKNKGGPLPKDKIELLASWIEQGASWPEEIVLKQKKAEEVKGGDELAIVTTIYQKIMSNLNARTEADMKPYSNSIPGTTVLYSMVPIRSGQFLMGSPATEKGRQPDEGPQFAVKIRPFWMGQYEVTWNEYELFNFPEQEKAMTSEASPYLDEVADAVSRPTKPYVEMSFGMGKGEHPAISMTQHAANKYCQWLSAKTGQYYRLPTEAEWEYAARAGTTSAYFFGDDPNQLPPGKLSPAVVSACTGMVEVQKGGSGDWVPVAAGAALQAGDKLRTGMKSTATIDIVYRQQPLRLSEKTTYLIKPADYLGQFAWWGGNGDFKYQKVGRKNPNPWGLYDIYGNAIEWCLDQYNPKGYEKMAAGSATEAWVKATQPYPHVVRGGHWDEENLAMFRSAARRGSDREWKQQDPQLPKSIWYHTDARFLGFRLVRPLEVPPPQELLKIWNSGVEKD